MTNEERKTMPTLPFERTEYQARIRRTNGRMAARGIVPRQLFVKEQIHHNGTKDTKRPS